MVEGLYLIHRNNIIITDFRIKKKFQNEKKTFIGNYQV